MSEREALFSDVQTLKALLKDAHDHGSGSQLHELHHYGVAIEALDRIEANFEDEKAMNKQVVEALRDLKANWHRIIDEQDDDGDPLIENLLYSAIDDLGGHE